MLWLRRFRREKNGCLQPHERRSPTFYERLPVAVHDRVFTKAIAPDTRVGTKRTSDEADFDESLAHKKPAP